MYAGQCVVPRCACPQVWTYRGRVAFVLSVTEKGRPVCDGIKLQRLKQLVTDIMTTEGSTVICDITKVRARGSWVCGGGQEAVAAAAGVGVPTLADSAACSKQACKCLGCWHGAGPAGQAAGTSRAGSETGRTLGRPPRRCGGRFTTTGGCTS